MINKTPSIKELCTEYLTVWTDAMNNDGNGLLSSWHSLHSWTIKHMANVLYPMAEKLGYGKNSYGTTIQQEYYRVDFTLYGYYEEAVWTLDYAIEHENAEFELRADGSLKQKGWYDEFAKLLPLKCAGGRVIIGYDEFTDEFYGKINKCLSLLNDSRIQPSLTDSPIALIIFPRSEYISKGNFNNGLIHLIEFYKNQSHKIWEINSEFEKEVLNDNTEKILQEVYKKIAK